MRGLTPATLSFHRQKIGADDFPEQHPAFIAGNIEQPVTVSRF
jgi:hypothetical protein